ncbi:MAG: ER membrane complex subunit 3 [Trizodia sp. TS-e1964]|nr:MAG: ER membrane complex subunit 3 [Trizodia sp. TS-e1964]
MAQSAVQTIQRDPALFYWILFPITIVLTGILRHYGTVMLQSTPKKLPIMALREQRSMLRGINLRNNYSILSPLSFQARKTYLVTAYQSGAFLKDPESKGQPPANPMTDPAGMEAMMGMMKGNMATMIPQTLIMGWINAFFSGFVIMKLPFPLTIRFKPMLQSGVGTPDLDVRWVSSLSWYFLNLFGLQSVFTFILGNENSASQVAAQMAQMNPNAAAALFGPGQDPDKMFMNEAENLEVVEHWWILNGIEDRLLKQIS